MILTEPRKVRWNNPAETAEVFAFAEFNGGYSHIVEDDGCWVVLNGGKPTSHIFPEAMEHLKQLPTDPKDHPLFWKLIDCYTAEEFAHDL